VGNGINTGFAVSKYNAVVCVTVIAFAAAFAAVGNTRRDVVEGHKVGSDAVVHGDEGLPHRWDGDIGGDGDQFVAFHGKDLLVGILAIAAAAAAVADYNGANFCVFIKAIVFGINWWSFTYG
jgi:hypothetical protein